MAVNMSTFFEYVSNLETKWDSKFKMQEENTAKKIDEMEAKIELNRLVREYESSEYINNHISKTNDKIAIASTGVGLIGVCITPIPVIGLVGVGIAIASGINGITHVCINSEGKIKLTNELVLGKLLKSNPGCTLHQARCAIDYLNKWYEDNPADQMSGNEDCSDKQREREYNKRIPKEYYFSPTVIINLKPII